LRLSLPNPPGLPDMFPVVTGFLADVMDSFVIALFISVGMAATGTLIYLFDVIHPIGGTDPGEVADGLRPNPAVG
jgi:hypothetical protein